MYELNHNSDRVTAVTNGRKLVSSWRACSFQSLSSITYEQPEVEQSDADDHRLWCRQHIVSIR